METFYKVFKREPTKREKIVLGRLIELYGERIVDEATRISVVVATGSPINYISAVAKNIFEERGCDFDYLSRLTKQRIEEIKSYESSSRPES